MTALESSWTLRMIGQAFEHRPIIERGEIDWCLSQTPNYFTCDQATLTKINPRAFLG